MLDAIRAAETPAASLSPAPSTGGKKENLVLAVAATENARRIAVSLGDTVLEASAKVQIALIKTDLTNYDKSISLDGVENDLMDAVELAKESKNFGLLMRSMNVLGSFYSENSSDQGAPKVDKAINIFGNCPGASTLTAS